MFASLAGVALALQLGVPAHPLNESIPPVQEILTQEILAQEIRYRRHGHPPPCGHGLICRARRARTHASPPGVKVVERARGNRQLPIRASRASVVP